MSEPTPFQESIMGIGRSVWYGVSSSAKALTCFFFGHGWGAWEHSGNYNDQIRSCKKCEAFDHDWGGRRAKVDGVRR